MLWPLDRIETAMHAMLASLYYPLARIRTWLRTRLRRMAFRIEFERHTHRGIDVWLHHQAPKGACAALVDALDLIARVDPVRFAQIPRLLPGGIAAAAVNWATAWYNRSDRRCYIGATSLAHGETADLATYIIHEMTHARLDRLETGADLDTRVRIEKICVRRELAFVHKLVAHGVPTPKDLVASIEDHLHDFPTELYTRATHQRSYRRVALEKARMLKQLDTPRWLRRWALLRLRRRLRAQRKRAALSTVPAE